MSSSDASAIGPASQQLESDSWKEELDKLAVTAALRQKQQDNEDWTWKQAVPLASSISKAWVRSGGSTVVTGLSFAEWNKKDILSCPKCGGVLHQVATLSCGHSFCRKCASSLDRCSKCSRTDVIQPDQLKTNVTVSTLVDKWWSNELMAIELRNAGNQAFADQHYELALEKYSQAVQSAPTDFTLLSNRSNVFAKIGKFEEALKDADQVIRLRPDWPKGHFRRAVALKGMARQEDALISLLHCAAMERSLLNEVRDDIAKALFAIILSVVKQTQTIERAKLADNCSRGSDDSSLSENSSSEEAPSPAPMLAAIAGSSSSEEEEDELLRNSPERMMALTIHHPTHPKLHLLVDRILADLDRLKKSAPNVQVRTVDTTTPGKLDMADFECTLCCRLMWQPVTTPCGHSFCRTCLDRCMDHTPACPLCKTSLEEYLAERRQCLTEFLDYAMSTYLPEEYVERSRLHDDEMKMLASSENIPIFICTMAYPTVRCPLHVFEPRYRLMIRRCMESGSRQFGMCSYVQDQPHGFAEFGTMLEVRDVEFFTDGRSVVDTVGGRRFRVLRRGVLDGYCTATVEYLVDQAVDPSRVDAVMALHDRVRQEAQNWISSAPTHLRQRILQHFGVMPDIEPDWMTLPDGPAWLWWLMAILPLNPKAQVAILSMTQIEKRLEAVQRGVAFVRQRTL